MPALLQQAQTSAKAPGRPKVAEPRTCVAAIRLTATEYDGLILLAGKASISDFCRELLSEALLTRQLRPARSPVSA